MSAARLVQTNRRVRFSIVEASPHQDKVKEKVLDLYWKGKLGLRAIAKLVDISHTTVWRIINENEPPITVREKLDKYLKAEERVEHDIAPIIPLIQPKKLKKVV